MASMTFLLERRTESSPYRWCTRLQKARVVLDRLDSAADLHEAALVCRTGYEVVLASGRGRTVDERVASAIAHWEPRFTANGVQPADFARVTASIQEWPDWCAAWVALGSEHEELGRDALGQGRLRSGGEHLAQAAAYYHFA
jgi:hypothetical protein